MYTREHFVREPVRDHDIRVITTRFAKCSRTVCCKPSPVGFFNKHKGCWEIFLKFGWNFMFYWKRTWKKLRWNFQCRIKLWSAPGSIFKSIPNTYFQHFFRILLQFFFKIFWILRIIFCNFFRKLTWKFHKVSIKIFFLSLCEMFPIFFQNFSTISS